MKKQKLSLIVLSAFLYGVGYWIVYPECFGACSDIVFSVGEPLMIFSITLLLLSIIVFFLSPAVFYAWKILVLVFVVLGLIMIPASASDWLLDEEIASWFLSILFFISSILLFIIVSLRNRNKSAK